MKDLTGEEIKEEVKDEKADKDPQLQTFQQRAFMHSINIESVHSAKDAALTIGWQPILDLLDAIEEKNKDRAKKKLGPLSVTAAFRRDLRKLRTTGLAAARQTEHNRVEEDHRQTVREQKDNGFKPDNETLWGMVDGESEAAKAARRFLITLDPVVVGELEADTP